MLLSMSINRIQYFKMPKHSSYPNLDLSIGNPNTSESLSKITPIPNELGVLTLSIFSRNTKK